MKCLSVCTLMYGCGRTLKAHITSSWDRCTRGKGCVYGKECTSQSKRGGRGRGRLRRGGWRWRKAEEGEENGFAEVVSLNGAGGEGRSL